jgi:hypothetical protein
VDRLGEPVLHRFGGGVSCVLHRDHVPVGAEMLLSATHLASSHWGIVSLTATQS